MVFNLNKFGLFLLRLHCELSAKKWIKRVLRLPVRFVVALRRAISWKRKFGSKSDTSFNSQA